MGYPRNLLSADETVELELHPHWKALFWPVLIALAVIAIVGWAVWVIPAGGAQQPVRIALVVLGGGLLSYASIRPFLLWLTTHYVITDRRLITRRGIIARTGRDMPLARINDISFSHSIFERLIGCGTLVVESAGERGQLQLTAVPRVEFVQRRLYELSSTTSESDEHHVDPPHPVAD
jgi:uncharacterized membrane protein YdbT with pleckstrin-like domain